VHEIAQLLSDSGVPVSAWTVKNILARSEEPPVGQTAPRAKSASRTRRHQRSASESKPQCERPDLIQPAHAVGCSSSRAPEQSETESRDRSARRSKDAPEKIRDRQLERKTTSGEARSPGARSFDRAAPGTSGQLREGNVQTQPAVAEGQGEDESGPRVKDGSSSGYGFIVRPDDERL
jgi:hypothetical protein